MKQSHDSKMRAMEQSIMASYRTKMDEMKESYDNKMDVMKQSITQSITASYQTTIDDKVSLYAADIVKLQMQLSVLVTKNEFIQRKLSGASLHAKDVPGLKTQTSALEAEIKSIHQKIAARQRKKTNSQQPEGNALLRISALKDNLQHEEPTEQVKRVRKRIKRG
eukprot:scaffold52017_cov48-Cyclotella_meneghiniana.AAC.3